jgi:hypothetical protein
VPADDVSVRRALYGKMAGDTTLNNLLATPPAGHAKSIFHEIAPDKASYPFVIFQKQAGTPTYTFQAGTAAYESDVWLIKAIDGPNLDETIERKTGDVVEGIKARLTTLLTDATLSISGGTLMYLRRESDVSYPEVSDGETYRHRGSLWRLTQQ